MRNGPELVRLQATYRGRLGVEVGIFVAVDHLRRADRLTEDEDELYFDIDDWFNANLPNPPFYEDATPLVLSHGSSDPGAPRCSSGSGRCATSSRSTAWSGLQQSHQTQESSSTRTSFKSA